MTAINKKPRSRDPIRWLRERMGLDFIDFVGSVNLDGCELSASIWQCVKYLVAVEEIDLSNTFMQDDDWRNLHNLPNIRCLYLRNAAVSDIEITQYVTSHRPIQIVDLSGSSVSVECIESLRRQFPDVVFFYK